MKAAFGSGGLFSEPFNNYIKNFELTYAQGTHLLSAIPTTSWGNFPSISVSYSSLLYAWPHTDRAEILDSPLIQMVLNQQSCYVIYLELLWMFLLNFTSRKNTE